MRRFGFAPTCAAGTRAATMFLRKHGVPDALAQAAARYYGTKTEEAVRADPYKALMALRHKAATFK